MGRDETETDAIIRELQEELLLPVKPENVSLLGHFKHVNKWAPFRVSCLYITGIAMENHQQFIRNHELVGASWFPLDELPPSSSDVPAKACELLRRKGRRMAKIEYQDVDSNLLRTLESIQSQLDESSLPVV